ncbi:chemotaxis protein CheB [Deinococcus aquaedulcis]|uniref:chemotaxis protein CheB n=1 Tax=Deinococcus aquaedulcis TaxID=2840455 RepID=UPI001C833378|nr:chemotaxis protein CheB [Deinococcus aquaedulcis]
MAAESTPLVVIGGSAGALGALLNLVQTLPPDFPAAVLVVVHVPPDQPSVLPTLLQRAGRLPAAHAEHGAPLRPGRILVAPPDHHLLVEGGRAVLSRGPRENHARPSIDVLFRSAAFVQGARAAGVVLSGMLDDGTSGLWAIRHSGGLALAQHPADAEYPDMPLSAIRQVEVHDVLSSHDLGPALVAWTRRLSAPAAPPAPDERLRTRLQQEVRTASGDADAPLDLLRAQPLSPVTCPECHGVMAQITEGTLTRYRCHTGHAYSASTLQADVQRVVDQSLGSAMRALNEQALLLGRLADQYDRAGQPREAANLQAEAAEVLQRAQVLRDLLQRPPATALHPPPGGPDSSGA